MWVENVAKSVNNQEYNCDKRGLSAKRISHITDPSCFYIGESGGGGGV